MEAFLLRRLVTSGELPDARDADSSVGSAYCWLGFTGVGEAALLFQSESKESLDAVLSAPLGSSCRSRTALPEKPGYGGLIRDKEN